MIFIACSSRDVASGNAAQALISAANLSSKGDGRYGNSKMTLQVIDSVLPTAKDLDSVGAELIIFMSRHSSAAGTAAFTVHPTGNWGAEARLGGEPSTLSTAAPSSMLRILTLFSKSQIKMEVTYEATHHGPTLKTPSLFAEFGGNETIINDKAVAAELARIVFESTESESKQVVTPVVGLGSTHYPRKFTELALTKNYAFSHMMPKHALSNPDGTGNVSMIAQAVEKSSEPVEKAVIDWKSLNSQTRTNVIKKLNEIGIDYERV